MMKTVILACNIVEVGIDKDLKRAGSAASRYEFFRLLLDDFLQTFERDAALWLKRITQMLLSVRRNYKAFAD